MAVISKELFYEKITKDMSCDLVHYWHPNCFLSFLHVAREVTLGAGEFYIPIYLVQAALRYKKIDKKYFKKLIKAYLQSVFYAIAYGLLFMSSFCIFTKIFGRIYYYCVGLIPGFCAACSIFLESKEMVTLNTISFFTLVVETILRYLQTNGTWSRNVSQETILFMTCSSLLMLLLSKTKLQKFTHFWFYTPIEDNGKYPEEFCVHDNACNKYCLDGASRYFLVGYAINFAKLLFGNIKGSSRSLKSLLGLILSKNNFLFGAFLGSYVGIYRAVTCLLLKKWKRKEDWHALLAAFLSGATYAIKPNLQMISISITTILQILLQGWISEKTTEKFRLKELLFIICTGILTHTLLANIEICPKYYLNATKTCTRGIILGAYKRVLETIVLKQ